MKISFWLILSFILSCREALAECARPEDFVTSVVEINRYNGYYEDYDSGTAWFYKNTKTLVTAAHVAKWLLLEKEDWSMLEIRQRLKPFTVWEKTRARILKIGNVTRVPVAMITQIESTAKEDIAIIELEADFMGGKPIEIAESDAEHFSNFLTVAYPARKFVFAKGEILPPEKENYPMGNYGSMLHLRVSPNRETLVPGASGAPIINCQGKVTGTLTMKKHDRFRLDDNKLIIRRKNSATNIAVHSNLIAELMRRE